MSARLITDVSFANAILNLKPHEQVCINSLIGGDVWRGGKGIIAGLTNYVSFADSVLKVQPHGSGKLQLVG